MVIPLFKMTSSHYASITGEFRTRSQADERIADRTASQN